MARSRRLGTVVGVSGRVNRRNYYRVLHVQHDAPAAVITSSYRALMRSLDMHPDRGGDHWNAAMINEAYRVLSDPSTRAAYDEMMLHRWPTHPPSPPAPGLELANPVRVPDVPVDREICLFCGTESIAPSASASCPSCASPLTMTSVPRPAGEGRRSAERVAREGALRYHVSWPSDDVRTGRLVDLSVGGLRMVTRDPIEVAHIVKLEGPLLDAVARVASCRPDPEGWSIGVEFYTLRFRNERGTFLSTTA